MPEALGLPTRVVAAPRADDLVDLVLHALVQHREPRGRGEREQPLLRDVGDLPEPEVDLVREWDRRLRGRADLDGVWLPLHGGSFCLGGS
jgi:hypothetical protein